MKKVSISAVLDKRYEKDDISPIRIRVTWDRQQKYFSTSKHANKEDFKKITAQKNAPERLQSAQKMVRYCLTRAHKMAEETIPFDFEIFRKKYLDLYGRDSIFSGFTEKETTLKNAGQLKTAIGYTSARASLMKFQANITYLDITPKFLKQYEEWILSLKVGKNTGRTLTRTTVSMYMRCIKHIINTAISEGIMPADKYPFGKNGYKIISGRNVKKSCTIDDIRAIMGYTPLNDMEARSRDLWLLSYFCNGMNFKDILNLKNSNLRGDYMVYTRSKTERKDQEPVQIYVSGPIRQLLNKYAIRNIKPDALLFSFLSQGADAEHALKDRQQFIKLTNKYMRRIAKALKIDKPLTTYYARHSYATILKRQGVSTEMISETLGHSDVRTTKNYLDGFENDALKKTAELLIPKLG